MKRRSNEFDRFLLVIRRTVNDYKMNVRCGSRLCENVKMVAENRF